MNERVVRNLLLLLMVCALLTAALYKYFSEERDAVWVTNDVSFELPREKLTDYRNRAKAGDNDAARALAYHYDAVGDVEESRRWKILAASREDCAAILSLISDETLAEQQRSYWKSQAEKIQCDGSYYFRNKSSTQK